jgi:hypothetical protein
VHLKAGEQLHEPLPPMFATELGHRGRKRLRLRPWPCIAVTEDSLSVMFLREIDKVEVHGERARDLLCAPERPGRHDPFGFTLVLVVVSRPDHRPAQCLDIRQQRGAAVVFDHPAELVAEQAHIATKLIGNCLTGGGARCARWLSGRQVFDDARERCAYSNESSSAASDASMMLLEQPTVVQRLGPLPDSTRTRVVAAVPASPSRMRTL